MKRRKLTGKREPSGKVGKEGSGITDTGEWTSTCNLLKLLFPQKSRIVKVSEPIPFISLIIGETRRSVKVILWAEEGAVTSFCPRLVIWSGPFVVIVRSAFNSIVFSSFRYSFLAT